MGRSSGMGDTQVGEVQVGEGVMGLVLDFRDSSNKRDVKYIKSKGMQGNSATVDKFRPIHTKTPPQIHK
jgi:hypothetical protein